MNKYTIYKRVRSFGFTATEAMNMMREEGEYTLYKEPCNCWKKHGRILCNNGGHYHARTYLHTLPEGWFVEDTLSREEFPGDEHERWVIAPDGGVVKLWGYWEERSWGVPDLEGLHTFKAGEAEFFPAEGIREGDFGLVRQTIERA